MAPGFPTRGPAFYAGHLVQQGREVSAGTIHRHLRRVGLGTRQQRLLVLEQHSARQAGLLTERTRRQLQRAREQRRHIQASQPGHRHFMLVYLDTFYVAALESGRHGEALRLARVQHHFLTTFVVPWTGALCDRIRTSAASGVYAGLADCVPAYVACDLRHLEGQLLPALAEVADANPTESPEEEADAT